MDNFLALSTAAHRLTHGFYLAQGIDGVEIVRAARTFDIEDPLVAIANSFEPIQRAERVLFFAPSGTIICVKDRTCKTPYVLVPGEAT